MKYKHESKLRQITKYSLIAAGVIVFALVGIYFIVMAAFFLPFMIVLVVILYYYEKSKNEKQVAT